MANGASLSRALGRIEATLESHEKSLSALWKQNSKMIGLAFAILGGLVLNLVLTLMRWGGR
jgi:hypothetical protein